MMDDNSTAKVNREDFIILSHLRAGDMEGMAELFDRYSGLIYSIMLHFLEDPEESEFVMQEILLELWRNPSSYEAMKRPLKVSLSISAFNRSRNIRRGRVHSLVT